jgi:NAD(P)H-nitrite reductase large subunit
VATPVTSFDVAARTVEAGGVTERFDAMVLASGSVPRRPRFPGEKDGMPVFTLWSMADAIAIGRQVRPAARLVVIGGSCLGVECALRAGEQQMRVTLVEQMPRLMPMLLGEGTAGTLREALADRGIAVCAGQAVAAFEESPDGVMGVRLGGGVVLAADMVLVCIGAAPNVALASQAGLATARGVQANACLEAAPGVFVAGDVCQAAGRAARGAVREAMAQGRLAGANAAAYLTGGRMESFVPAVIPATLRCAGVDVSAAGQVAGLGTDGREERMDDGSRRGVFCAVTKRANGSIAGVQMVGSREGFDALVAQITG